MATDRGWSNHQERDKSLGLITGDRETSLLNRVVLHGVALHDDVTHRDVTHSDVIM